MIKDGGGPGRLAGLRGRIRPGLRAALGTHLGTALPHPVVKVTGSSSKRVSLAALIAVKPGCRARLIYRVRRGPGLASSTGFSPAPGLTSSLCQPRP